MDTPGTQHFVLCREVVLFRRLFVWSVYTSVVCLLFGGLSSLGVSFIGGFTVYILFNVGIDDLKDVLDAVKTLSSQWSLLATMVGVKQSSLDIIKHNHPGDAKMCLYEALGEWLKLNYDHQRHGRPSWRKLAEAVKSLDYRLF